MIHPRRSGARKTRTETSVTNFSLSLLGLFASLAMSTLTPATASAAGQVYINGAKFTGTETAEGINTTSMTFTSTVSGIKVKELCDHGVGKGTITDNNKGTISPGLELSECSLVEPSSCKAPAHINTVKLQSELEVESTKVFVNSFPESGTNFVVIEIENCALEGEYEINGSARCEVVEPEVEAVTKECDFTTTSGSKMKLGRDEASLVKVDSAKLTGVNSGKAWTAKTS